MFFSTGDATAFHLGGQNEVLGIDTLLYDNTVILGSQDKQLGLFDMAALTH